MKRYWTEAGSDVMAELFERLTRLGMRWHYISVDGVGDAILRWSPAILESTAIIRPRGISNECWIGSSRDMRRLSSFTVTPVHKELVASRRPTQWLESIPLRERWTLCTFTSAVMIVAGELLGNQNLYMVSADRKIIEACEANMECRSLDPIAILTLSAGYARSDESEIRSG